MRVICDDCPMWSWISGCRMKYITKPIDKPNEYGSNSCRLVKIVTLDGEIFPEPEEVKK